MHTIRDTVFLIVLLNGLIGLSREVVVAEMEVWETWSPEELEKQMSPSQWNPSKSPDEVIKDYIEASLKGTQSSGYAVDSETDIPYGQKGTERIDIYGTDLPQDAPIFFWIHGGYWQEGAKEYAGQLAKSLHSQGIRNVVLGYTLAPKATIREIEDEVFTALQYVVQKYRHAKIVVGGHSAGAQLAAMLLHKYTDLPQDSNIGYAQVYKQVSGLVLVSGIYDLRPLVPTSINKPLRLSTSSAEASSPLRIKKIRQEFLDKFSSFQILITIGGHDSPEFQRQAEVYYQLLRRSFPNTKLSKSNSDDHFTLVDHMANNSTDAGSSFAQFTQDFANGTSKNGGVSMSASIFPALASLLLVLG